MKNKHIISNLNVCHLFCFSLFLLLLGPLGCGQAPSADVSEVVPRPSETRAASLDDSSAPTQSASNKTDGQSPTSGDREIREWWDVQTIQGARSGHIHTTITPETREGKQVLRIAMLQHLVVKRLNQTLEMDVRLTSIETPEGEVIQFESDMDQGPTPLRTRSRVKGDKLVLETTTAGKTITTSMPWSAHYRGFYGLELSLARKPLQPGQKRTLQLLVPVMNQVAQTELVARDYEAVELLEGTRRLLRINTKTTMPGGISLPGSIWIDQTGQILKSFTQAMNIVGYRTTKAIALDQSELGRIDLTTDLAIKVKQALKNPHTTKKVCYRVHLEGGDPVAVFDIGPSQAVRSLDAHTAEVTVYALRPGSSGNSKAPKDLPSEDDLKPNSLIQCDDPKIIALAQELVGKEKDPWKVAIALEKGVRHYMTLRNYSQAFATAAEVVQSKEGDCTEHAVLMAALARSLHVPARVAMGLVYLESEQSFFYHMWTEVYIQDRWIPMDATLAMGGIGAAHLKLAHSNLHGASAYSCFLPVAQVIGQLKIGILQQE